jgi:hypothetical protein
MRARIVRKRSQVGACIFIGVITLLALMVVPLVVGAAPALSGAADADSEAQLAYFTVQP